MTRIRYTKENHAGEQFSVKVFQHPTNGSRYRVKMHTSSLMYWIIDEACDQVAKEGEAVSPHKLKIAAKDALSSLGIAVQEKETRAPRKAKQQA